MSAACLPLGLQVDVLAHRVEAGAVRAVPVLDGGAGAGGGAGGDVLAGPQAAGRAGEGDEEPAPGTGPPAGYKVYGSWVKNQENIVNKIFFIFLISILVSGCKG